MFSRIDLPVKSVEKIFHLTLNALSASWNAQASIWQQCAWNEVQCALEFGSIVHDHAEPINVHVVHFPLTIKVSHVIINLVGVPLKLDFHFDNNIAIFG